MAHTDYSAPARKARNLTAAQVSDTVDHVPTVKPPLVANNSDHAVTIASVPVDAPTTTVVVTVPVGVIFTFPFVTRRIKSSGSTGLTTALTAGTLEVVLLEE